MQFETDRFIIRTLIPSDATPRYISWFEDEEVNKYIMSSPQSLDSIAEFIAAQNDDPNAYLLGIFDKESGDHIGNIKYHFSDPARKVVEFGVLIGDTRWRRKGVMTEALPVFPKYCAQAFGTKTVLLGVDQDNVAAFRGYEKMGFDIVEKEHYPDVDKWKVFMMIDIDKLN